MILRTDDSLYRVDAKWLGPKGNTLPFAARYSAYAMGFVAALVFVGLFNRVGVPFGPFTIIASIGLAVGLTTLVHRRIDAERPVRAVAVDFWHEVCTPRPPHPIRATVSAGRRRR